jgi:hypothetical protein
VDRNPGRSLSASTEVFSVGEGETGTSHLFSRVVCANTSVDPDRLPSRPLGGKKLETILRTIRETVQGINFSDWEIMERTNQLQNNIADPRHNIFLPFPTEGPVSKQIRKVSDSKNPSCQTIFMLSSLSAKG